MWTCLEATKHWAQCIIMHSPDFQDGQTGGQAGAALGKGERKVLDWAFSVWREAGECLAQPASQDKRNLLTRSPCSREALFRELPASSQSGSCQLGYFRGSTLGKLTQQLCLGSRPCLWRLGPREARGGRVGGWRALCLCPLHLGSVVDSGHTGPSHLPHPTETTTPGEASG